MICQYGPYSRSGKICHIMDVRDGEKFRILHEFRNGEKYVYFPQCVWIRKSDHLFEDGDEYIITGEPYFLPEKRYESGYHYEVMIL